MASDAPVEDDDAWLYGDNSVDDQRKEEINAIFDRATEEIGVPGEEGSTVNVNGDIHQPVEHVENGEVAPLSENEPKQPDGNEEEKDSEEEDDSDEDDVQITIGDIKPATAAYPYGGTPVNLNIKRGRDFSSTVTGTSASKSKGIDLETVGVINGVSIYEFNLDSIEDKPWRKPGADITDYFNYGFNEDTWKAYCEKQRKLRVDNNVSLKTPVVTGKDQQIPIATVNENSKYSGMGAVAKKAGPPPGRRMSGSIDVICGTTTAGARRAGNAKENVIQVMTGRTDVYDGPPGVPPGHLPPTHLPPPFIPPNLSVPPPGIPPGLPPPSIPPPPGTIPGHVPFPDLYGNPIFSQPPPPVPGVSVDNAPQYDEQFFTGNQTPHSQYDGHSESTQQSWTNSPRERERDRGDRERDRNRDRDREKEREGYGSWGDGSRDHDRERSSGRPSDEDYSKRRDEYERRRYRDYRDRRDKDRYERDYDRDRDDKHERERERERRHRDHRERDDRHRERSSRRRHHHDEEEEHHSSRHKHKKSKRDKEDSSLNAHETDERSSQHDPEVESEVKSS